MNYISNFCEVVGENIEDVAKVISYNPKGIDNFKKIIQ